MACSAWYTILPQPVHFGLPPYMIIEVVVVNAVVV
jgi:hypothetical protein